MINPKSPGIIQTYIIKDGKIIFNIKDTEYSDLQGGESKSNLEVKMYQILTNRTEREARVKTLENIYGDVTDSGYTVVRFNENNNNRGYVFIGNKICQKDAEIVYMLLKKHKICKTLSVFNRVNSKNGNEFEIQICPKNEAKALDIFFREKLGQLTLEDRNVLEKYRTFNLSLYLNLDYPLEAIHNYNSALILITPDQYIKKGLTERAHIIQISQIIRQLYYNEYLKNPEFEFEEVADTFKSIIATIFSGEIFFYLPKKLNEFQYKSLQSFINDVKLISQQEKDDVTINFEDNNCNVYGCDPESTMQYFEKHKEDLLEQNIKPLDRSKPPESMHISNDFLSSIFGIKPNIGKVSNESAKENFNPIISKKIEKER